MKGDIGLFKVYGAKITARYFESVRGIHCLNFLNCKRGVFWSPGVIFKRTLRALTGQRGDIPN